MNTQTIEQIDRRRYRLNLWRAVGLVLWVGGILAQTIVPDRTPFWSNFSVFVYGFGLGLAGVTSAVSLNLTGKIRRDANLNQALNNEMYVHYTNKSAKAAFYAMMAAGIVLGGATWSRLGNVDISGEMCCLVILFAGVVTQAVALLVYDRS
jgi:hypothetical protein